MIPSKTGNFRRLLNPGVWKNTSRCFPHENKSNPFQNTKLFTNYSEEGVKTLLNMDNCIEMMLIPIGGTKENKNLANPSQIQSESQKSRWL